MIVKDQSNIKVHFAGSENIPQFYGLEEVGVNYALYSVFAFLERTVLKSKKAPIMPAHLKDNPQGVPNYINSKMRHTIQDSGLFTLMFGSHKGKKDSKLMDAWYNALVEFTLKNDSSITCVEVDCQKVLGVEKAWEYRERLRHDIPNRVINVFHKEDGQKGLDRLIEFSDYIAISVPELRFMGQKGYVVKLANYIKNKKPSIDIHLLGCTEIALLKQLTFCTSSDSTTYLGGKRYGYLGVHYSGNINKDRIIELVGRKSYNRVAKWNNEYNSSILLLGIYTELRKYNKHAGCQK